MNGETPEPEDPLEPEPEKPRFLLPDGCKDLIDALRLQEEEARKSQPQPPHPPQPQAPAVVECSVTFVPPKRKNPPKGLPANVKLPELISVRDLSALLGLKPVELMGSLMAFNVFASFDMRLRFELASALCSHYGVVAHRVA